MFRHLIIRAFNGNTLFTTFRAKRDLHIASVKVYPEDDYSSEQHKARQTDQFVAGSVTDFAETPRFADEVRGPDSDSMIYESHPDQRSHVTVTFYEDPRCENQVYFLDPDTGLVWARLLVYPDKGRDNETHQRFQRISKADFDCLLEENKKAKKFGKGDGSDAGQN